MEKLQGCARSLQEAHSLQNLARNFFSLKESSQKNFFIARYLQEVLKKKALTCKILQVKIARYLK